MPDKLNRRGQLTRDTAALLLVDHQVGLYTGVRDIDTLELKHNVVGLTKALRALKIPVVVTTTTEKMWGPLIPLSLSESPKHAKPEYNQGNDRALNLSDFDN